jgi:hypothetical protein
MQSLLDIYSVEIAKLLLKFNSKKYVTLRIGDRHNYDRISLTLDVSVVSIVDVVIDILAS